MTLKVVANVIIFLRDLSHGPPIRVLKGRGAHNASGV